MSSYLHHCMYCAATIKVNWRFNDDVQYYTYIWCEWRVIWWRQCKRKGIILYRVRCRASCYSVTYICGWGKRLHRHRTMTGRSARGGRRLVIDPCSGVDGSSVVAGRDEGGVSRAPADGGVRPAGDDDPGALTSYTSAGRWGWRLLRLPRAARFVCLIKCSWPWDEQRSFTHFILLHTPRYWLLPRLKRPIYTLVCIIYIYSLTSLLPLLWL